jgi:hypothetical protein
MELIPNLIFLYHCMIASESLLIEAEKRAEGTLKRYFAAHLEEERGHDCWLAEDLASVGILVKNTKIPLEAVEMVGTIYYMVFHVEPCALLGYMHVLERGEHPLMTQWESQYPASLLRTLKYHEEHDREHQAELDRIIETLSPTQKAIVAQTRERTLHYLLKVFT